MKAQRAYDYMISLIDSGFEFPDAESKASLKFGVSCEALREMYDDQSTE